MPRPAYLHGVGAAAPAWRLDAADVARAWNRAAPPRASDSGSAPVTPIGLCAPDEDALTLAAEAADRALTAAGVDAAAVDGLWWGTTRPPYAEGPSHAVLAAALGLSEHAGGLLASGSPHAGMDALLAAADAIGAGTARLALVVVSDALVPGPGTAFEARSGAGGAAIVLGAEPGPAVLGPRVTRSAPTLDRYRGDGEHATRDIYDVRLFRDKMFLPAIGEVVEHLGAFTPRAWSLPDPDGRLGRAAATRAGLTPPASRTVYDALGDTGAAASLLGAIGSLDAAGTVAIVATGGGRTTGVLVEADAPVPGATAVGPALAGGRPASYADALRRRDELRASGETVPMGVPAASAMFWRDGPEILGLLGARCAECGTVNTPPAAHPVCLQCGSAKLELVPLARAGTVHTFVVNETMPAPFVAPLPLVVVDLDDDARIMLQAASATAPSDLSIGARVVLVLRRYAHERGIPVYGWKVRAL